MPDKICSGFVRKDAFAHAKAMVIKMRIDKFLKVSRIIKRRTVANDACDTGHISVNGKQVKASYDVKLGDIVSVTFGARTLTFEVTDIKEHVLKDGAGELYRVIDQG